MCFLKRQPRLQFLALVALVCGISGLRQASLQGQSTESLESNSPFVQSVAPTIAFRFQNEQWSWMQVEVVNPSDEDYQVTTGTFFVENPDEQFGRHLWVPAHSRRNGTFAIKPHLPRDKDWAQIEMRTRLIRYTNSQGETTEIAALKSERTTGAVVETALDRTAYIGPEPEKEEKVRDNRSIVYHAARAFRSGNDEPKLLFEYTPATMPKTATELVAYQHMIIGDDRVADDPLAMSAIRKWIHQGGNIWLLIDRLQQSTVEQLLGNSCEIEYIDDAHLSQISPLGKNGEFEVVKFGTQDFLRPIHMRRVMTEDSQVTVTQDGWPVFFFKDVGKGRVMFSTLDVRSMLQNDKSPGDMLRAVGRQYWTQKNPFQLDEDVAYELLNQQIGYQITSRTTMFCLLAGFCVLLGSAAYIGHRKQETRVMLFAGPTLAMAASIVIVLIGFSNRHNVPTTQAKVQLVQVSRGSNEVSVQGLSALYLHDVKKFEIGADREGFLIPHAEASLGGMRRVLWNDHHAFGIQNFQIPAGTSYYRYSGSMAMTQPIRCQVGFGDGGMHGRLIWNRGESTDVAKLTDAIVVGGMGAIPVAITEGNDFEVPADEIFVRGEFVRSQVLAEENLRHQTVYRKLFENRPIKKMVDVPTMMFWTNALQDNTTFPEVDSHKSSNLVIVPIDFEIPKSGEAVVFPSQFLGFRSAASPDGRKRSATYNQISGQFLDSDSPLETHFAFGLPNELSNVQWNKAVLELEIQAENRIMKVIGFNGLSPVVLDETTSPQGNKVIEINDPNVLKMNGKSEILLGVYVGKLVDFSKLASWKINDMKLRLEGVAQ